MNTMPNQFGLDLKNSSLLDDASVARLYASEAISMMRRSGYTVTMEFHLGDWADIMANIPDRVMLNPAFDPTHSDLDPSNSFWLRVSDRNGTVAIIADKLVECDDYLVEMAAGRIYYRDPGPNKPSSWNLTYRWPLQRPRWMQVDFGCTQEHENKAFPGFFQDLSALTRSSSGTWTGIAQ